MKFLLVAGGSLTIDFVLRVIHESRFDRIISIDGGANVLFQGKILPDFMLGDFDSIQKEILAEYEAKGVKKHAFQSEKDMTDTELAILFAIDAGAKELTLIGGIGSRMDHTLSNLFLVEKYSKHVNFILMDENNLIRIYHNQNDIHVSKGNYRYISLIPISTAVWGVTTFGLKYPLVEATLYRDSSLGVSNEVLSDEGRITMEEGILTVILSKDE